MPFEDQVTRYLQAGTPALLGLGEPEFRDLVAPLRGLAAELGSQNSMAVLPAVLVVPGVTAEAMMPHARQGSKAGYVDMRPVGPQSFVPLAAEQVPVVPYLIVDVDTGADTLNMAPREAAILLRGRGRHPLTLEEGVAVVLTHPGVLRSHNNFQMLAARDGSKRIPSLWVTKEGRPRLGWCYEGMPHSWLGAASCGARLAPAGTASL